jgi:hypothetical protein
MRGGFSNRRSIRRGEIKASTCESILDVPPPPDPTKGKKKLTRDRGGRAKGTERNDNLLGSRGPDTLIGPSAYVTHPERGVIQSLAGPFGCAAEPLAGALAGFRSQQERDSGADGCSAHHAGHEAEVTSVVVFHVP